MKKTGPESLNISLRCMAAVWLSMVFFWGTPSDAWADEADAKRILNSMSDYMAEQKSFSFDFDATLEIVTNEEQKLALASSGRVALNRPDKINVTRFGGFTDMELYFDGKTLTLLGKNLNLYTQLEVPGTIDHLVDELKDTYHRPLPAADLLLSNAYDELMRDVVDVKDLGSGVIGGIECDYLAFRTKDVDWQIWIARGDHPYPCRYVITSKLISGIPQYTVQIRNWKTGGEVPASTFSFSNTTNAKKVELNGLKGTEVFPEHFTRGDAQ